MTNASYTFLPWFRRGIAGLIGGAQPQSGARASVHVDITISGEPISGGAPLAATVPRDVELYGPGDIVGIDPRAVVRVDPRDWITDAEPNYLAHIEFYEEDFPWRYTPAAPFGNGLKLTPWLTLAVFEAEKDKEFKEIKGLTGRPLPFIKINDMSALPKQEDLWAWAHVQMNQPLFDGPLNMVSSDMSAVLGKLHEVLSANPDFGCSRIVCPRKLKENTAYHAFLIPTFETGRLAGLGLEIAASPAPVTSAWADYPARPEPSSMPYYHNWYFRTGADNDFESLVRLLVPRIVDPRVGLRDVDVQNPGPVTVGIFGAPMGGILKLGGALRAPDAEDTQTWKKNEAWDDNGPHPFQSSLASLINLADDYQKKDAGIANQDASQGGGNPAAGIEAEFASDDDDEERLSPDPLVVPPLYGRWHAAVSRLLVEQNGTSVANPGNWVHELNLDPRFRVAAGAGTRVIQKKQEDYMQAAWAQVGDVLEANRKMRWSQYARQISNSWYERRFLLPSMSDDRFLRLTRPAHRRVLSDGKTVRSAIDKSRLTASLLSTAASRVMRPRGRLIRMISQRGALRMDQVLSGINTGKLSLAPPKTVPAGLLSTEQLGRDSIKRALEKGRIPPDRGDEALLAGSLLNDRDVKLDALEKLAKLETLAITDPDEKEPDRAKGSKGEAAALRQAASDWLNLISASSEASKRLSPEKLDVSKSRRSLAEALNPLKTIRGRTLSSLNIPNRLVLALEEEFDEIWHHPVIDIPMYKPLEQLSKDFFLPNLSLIPQNCITTVETNQPFIEAYMVGLNHEFSRELLWREYPTDQRGSVFRQFWDVKGLVAPPGADRDEFRESIRDIPKIHQWPRASKLGAHDNREPPGESDAEIVLVIRGELLKKYPNTVIYAHRAQWALTNNQPDVTKERELVEVKESELDNPKKSEMRFPLFEAKVEPDIYFFGFDLNADEARGSIVSPLDPGWFFVLKERPGETRFGFDVKRDASNPLQTVNDFAWTDIIPQGSTDKFVNPALLASFGLSAIGPNEGEKTIQHAEDAVVSPVSISAARWAYLLYQVPVMVAVHAAEMLKQNE